MIFVLNLEFLLLFFLSYLIIDPAIFGSAWLVTRCTLIYKRPVRSWQAVGRCGFLDKQRVSLNPLDIA